MKRRLKRIPAPGRWILAGARRRSGQLHVDLANLARQNGGIAEFQLWHRRLVAVTDPNYAHEILVTHRARYLRGADNRSLRILTGDGLLATENGHWQDRRRRVQPCFRPNQVEDLVPALCETVQGMLGDWETWRLAQQPIRLLAEMQNLAILAIARTLFSARPARREALRLAAAVRSGFRMVMRRSASLFAPPLWLPFSSCRALRESRAVLDEFVRTRLDARLAGSDPGSADTLAALLTSHDPNTYATLPREALLDELRSLIVAGFETTAAGLFWSLYLLARHPEVAAKWHEELDRVLDGRFPTAQDLPRLPYTSQVVHEALRLYPPIHTLARECVEEDEVDGYRMPRGVTVLISVYGIQRGAAWGPDPDAFRPERFAAADWPRRAFLPFANGRHLCLGNHFALAEMMTTLALIGQRYRLELADDRPLDALAEISLVPSREMPVLLHPRRTSGVRKQSQVASAYAGERKPLSCPFHQLFAV
jgi:cytochrome P450